MVMIGFIRGFRVWVHATSRNRRVAKRSGGRPDERPRRRRDLRVIRLQRNVPLARQTTCGIGGPARFFVEAGSSAELVEAVAWARAQRLPVSVLGRGSNLLVGDGGVEGLVVRSTRRTDVEVLEDG